MKKEIDYLVLGVLTLFTLAVLFATFMFFTRGKMKPVERPCNYYVNYGLDDLPARCLKEILKEINDNN